MVNDMMVCVDRIITSSSCLRSVNQETDRNSSGNFHLHLDVVDNDYDYDVAVTENGTKIQNENLTASGSSERELLRECRICQEEDDQHSLEAPCACNGTLKFAHRVCIQKWCNKKGDITCEICNQVFTPNYSLPPPRPNPDVMAVDISQMWGHHFGFREHHLLALAAAERQLFEPEYDEYGVANVGNISCLRSIAIILMFVLLIHQVLIISRDFGLVQGYSAFFHFQVSFLQVAGFLLPCYVLVRSWYILHTRRRRQS